MDYFLESFTFGHKRIFEKKEFVYFSLKSILIIKDERVISIIGELFEPVLNKKLQTKSLCGIIGRTL